MLKIIRSLNMPVFRKNKVIDKVVLNITRSFKISISRILRLNNSKIVGSNDNSLLN